ncbi:hypothetical protein [Methylobacterium oryzihabitans]|uniref:Uncharacterized protein n=1 Tax=Methylobacterium oryzihabitans TaxID=2499852 RepID=A0A437P5H5_9HYPH|nr:hypothetical protein [Methylobacterium oryzihabitans]RVU17513.1 hypothetical protein EOE48_14085 [Methylobacterium oryzihabitans]
MLDALIHHGKTAAAAIGVVGSLGAAYLASGLPVPATQAFVRAEVAGVAGKIDGLTLAQLELQRRTLVHTRARLRAELTASGALRARADAVHRLALDRRAAEIGDELAELEREDEGLRLRIDRLRAG